MGDLTSCDDRQKIDIVDLGHGEAHDGGVLQDTMASEEPGGRIGRRDIRTKRMNRGARSKRHIYERGLR